MQGFYLYLATCHEQALKDWNFVLGLEAKQLLDIEGTKISGLELARTNYSFWRTKKSPEFDEVMNYINNSENNPIAFWNKLSEEQKQSTFFRGMCWQILVDFILHNGLSIDTLQKIEMSAFFYQHSHLLLCSPEINEFKKIQAQELERDWKEANTLVSSYYPGNSVYESIVEKTKFHYISWKLLVETLAFLRSVNPLITDMNILIHEVMEGIA